MNPCLVFGTLSLLGFLQDPGEGQRLLRENRLDEARAVFEKALAQSPGNVDALVGAGFTALRQNRIPEAMAHFRRTLELSPGYADAAYGLALGHWRRGQVEAARRFAQEALRLDPAHQEARALLARMPAGLLPVPSAPPYSAELQVPFRTTAEAFQVHEGSRWRTLYLKGVNLGAALPGRFPTEFPGKEVYQGWLKEMGELGINVLRIYTIHPPAFYEALREHNLHAPHPIYLLHGLWVEPPPGNDFEDPAWFGAWREDMRRMVDLLHGRASFLPRPGFTGGNYRSDVSPWWIGTILGREWEPFNVVAFNRLHPGESDWKGRFVAVSKGNATEVFMAKAMDTCIATEHDTYRTQRPVAFSNWPTLDPLTHPTETPFAEEQQLRKKLGMSYVSETKGEVLDDDSVALDMEKFTALETCQGGLFASYHIYPNYPEFINLDPKYSRAMDTEGPNNYFGYLLDLRRWHQKFPVLVSEFGLSDSRIPAHWQPQGMTHGGLDEKAQARLLQRLVRDIHDAGYAGCIAFAWMDEWFKKTWQVSPIELPAERKPLWFNAMDAEENYGIIGLQPGAKGPNIVLDGNPEGWKAIPIYQRSQDLELKLFADEGWLHMGIFWTGPRPDWDSERFVLGLDTFDPVLGNHHLPYGVPLRSEAGLKFAVELSGNECEVWVDAPYDYSPHIHGRPVRSIAHEDGPWHQMQTETNRLRVGRDSTVYPARRYDLGSLRKGTQDRTDPAFDSLADWNEGPGFLEVRIPWSLLQVTDPSSRRVLQDPPQPEPDSPYGTLVTEGFRVCLVRLRQPEPGKFQAVEALPAARQGEIPLPPLFTWKSWERPQWHAFHKLAFNALKESYAALPEAPGPVPEALPDVSEPPPPPSPVPVKVAGMETGQLLDQARKARDQKDWSSALTAYDAILKQDPKDETALFERAQFLGWAERFQESAKAWRLFRERVPTRGQEADKNLAEVASWGKDYDLAIRTLQPYVQKGERWAVLDSAKYLSWAGSYRRCFALTSSWLTSHPEDEDALLIQARTLSWDGRLRAAQAAYARLLELRPENGEARMGLAQIAAWRGRLEESRAEFEKAPKDTREAPEGRLLEAQITLGEGRRRAAVEKLEPLAAPGSAVQQDALELLHAAAEGNGPMVELGGSRTDSSDDLRAEDTSVHVRMPFGDGSLGLGYARHGSRFNGDGASPHEVSVSLAQALGDWRVSAEVGRMSGLGGDQAGFHRLGLESRLGRGMELSLNQSRSLVVATPVATAGRIGMQGYGAGFTWSGFTDTLHLQGGTASLSAGNRQTTWSGAYEHRWRVSPFTLGAGLTTQSLSYSVSLPLGFWNPERFRFHGLTGSAAFERGRFSLSANAKWGKQVVDDQDWTTGWGYGVDMSWRIGRSPFTLVSGWSASTSGLNAASVSEPSQYQEHTFRIGVRAAGF